MSDLTPIYGPRFTNKLDWMGVRFADEPGDGTGAGAAAATDASAGTETASTTATGTETNAGAAENVSDLPQWAQKIITDTRKEAGDHRSAAKTAATNAQKEFADKIAVALGLKEDAAKDPAALTASLAESQRSATNSARELAVFKAATAAGADPNRLLDRASFLTSIGSVDPTDGAAIAAAIKAAVDADQTLKAARAAGASAVDNPGGTGEAGQITEAQLAQMTPEQISAAYDKGLLKDLL